MCKDGVGYLSVAVAFVLLAAVVFLPPGAGPGALEREMAFSGELHNSLYHLDLAKWKWAEENPNSGKHVPTMADLTPYLGNWTNSIHRLIKFGVTFQITPASEDEEQSDIATLTRDLHFKRGYCRFYISGTRYSIRTHWTIPEYDRTSRLQAFYFNNRELVAGGLLMLTIGSLLVLAVCSRSSRA